MLTQTALWSGVSTVCHFSLQLLTCMLLYVKTTVLKFQDNYRNYFEYPNIYSKFPKYSDTLKFAVIILKFEQCGSTIQKMQTEWQTDLGLHYLPICPKTWKHYSRIFYPTSRKPQTKWACHEILSWKSKFPGFLGMVVPKTSFWGFKNQNTDQNTDQNCPLTWNVSTGFLLYNDIWFQDLCKLSHIMRKLVYAIGEQ